jgi:SAM-dependent methyltransferase
VDKRWNHNIHYHDVLLDSFPNDANAVLDVGCGVGTLTRSLLGKARRIVGIDLDESSITLARAAGCGNVEYIVGDFLSYPFEPESFDCVLSVAMLHHVDFEVGLRRMRELAKPGGIIGVIGLACDVSVTDYALGVLGLVSSWILSVKNGYWEHPSPTVWPPPESWGSVRRIAARELPGVRFRRHLLWRYSLIWRKTVSNITQLSQLP